jgi:hypothetical protein
VKSFAFRLDQVLGWRQGQVALQKSRVSAAAGRAATIDNKLNGRKREYADEAARIALQPSGADLKVYAGFADFSRREACNLQAQLKDAQAVVMAEMNALVEANRRVLLLQNLQSGARAAWVREFDRETAELADESFSAGYNRGKKRARSSGG